MRFLTLGTLALVTLVVLTGCSLLWGEGPRQTRPPDATDIRVYTLGAEAPEPVKWVVRSDSSADQVGFIGTEPEAACIVVGPGWQMDVSIEEAEQPLATKRSGDFSDSSPLDLTIERGIDGSIHILEGVPDWWRAEPPVCTDPN